MDLHLKSLFGRFHEQFGSGPVLAPSSGTCLIKMITNVFVEYPSLRNLLGVPVRLDKKVEWDPNVERVYLDSGKPLVPDYAMSFVNGSSSNPFARLWWDETVPTVVTRAEPHNQDRVLSIRENARLQGFPDYYKLCGPVKERYIQVGNAVAVHVAREGLGYSLGLAYQGSAKEEGPLFRLPNKFSNKSEANWFTSFQEDA